MDERLIEELKEIECAFRKVITQIKNTPLSNDSRVLDIVDNINALSVEI